MRPSLVAFLAPLALLAPASPAPAAQALTIPLPVRVYDTAGLSDSMHAAALAVASGALAAADVDPVWRRCDSGRSVSRCDAPLRSGELVIRIVRARGPVHPSRAHVLGDAMIDASTGSGRLATIYFDRVLALARASSVDAARLLGHAIAHELGHLLLATGTHSGRGLMRAVWTPAHVRQTSQADWSFTEQEIAAIRTRQQAGRMAQVGLGTTASRPRRRRRVRR
jgi:hypothetical protein